MKALLLILTLTSVPLGAFGGRYFHNKILASAASKAQIEAFKRLPLAGKIAVVKRKPYEGALVKILMEELDAREDFKDSTGWLEHFEELQNVIKTEN